MPILTVKLWAQPISPDDEKKLLRPIVLGNLYYRRLAQIENAFRAELRALGQSFEQIGALVQALRDLPPDDRKGPPGDALRKDLNAAQRRRNADPAYRAQADEISQRMFAAKRAARAASGLAPGAWGTYQRIEDHHDQASRTTHWSEDVDPHRALAEGEISVHHQDRNHPISIDTLTAGTWSFCQLDPDRYARGRLKNGFAERSTGPGDWGPSHSIDRPPAKRLQEMRIRVDSNGRMPVWARLHVLVRDQIPAGKISWVRVHRTKVGPRYDWSVQVVVETAQPFHAPAPVAEVVGVDLRCGRRVDGGRLLAHARGSDGETFSLVLPDVQVVQAADRTRSVGCIDHTGKIASLISIRDRSLNETVQQIAAFGQSFPQDHAIYRETTHAHLWRRWSRVARFARKLGQAIASAEAPAGDATDLGADHGTDRAAPPSPIARADIGQIVRSAPAGAIVADPTSADSTTPGHGVGDDDLPWDPISPDQIAESRALVERLRAILKQDRHLYAWHTSFDRKLDRRIRGRVQQWCAMLANRYQSIAFEDLSIRDLREQAGWLGDVVARRIQSMAPGRVRQFGEQAAKKRGRTFLLVDARNTTRACSACGHLRDGDLAASTVTCEQCGKAESPQDTAVANILRRAKVEIRLAEEDAKADQADGGSGEAPQRRVRRNRRSVKAPAAASVSADAVAE